MVEKLPTSIHEGATVSGVRVTKPFLPLRGEADWRVSVGVRVEGREKEVRGPWSMAAAVRRWGDAASNAYKASILSTETFVLQKTILVGTQAMVEAMIDSRGGWENGFMAVRNELRGISFPRELFGGGTVEQLSLVRQILGEWWSNRNRSNNPPDLLKKSEIGRRCMEMIMKVESRSGRELAYELVKAGLGTLARRRVYYRGEVEIPLPSEALGPLRFFGIELLSGGSAAGGGREAELIKRAGGMRVTSIPGTSESRGARRERLIKAEVAFRGWVARERARVKERKGGEPGVLNVPEGGSPPASRPRGEQGRRGSGGGVLGEVQNARAALRVKGVGEGPRGVGVRGEELGRQEVGPVDRGGSPSKRGASVVERAVEVGNEVPEWELQMVAAVPEGEGKTAQTGEIEGLKRRVQELEQGLKERNVGEGARRKSPRGIREPGKVLLASEEGVGRQEQPALVEAPPKGEVTEFSVLMTELVSVLALVKRQLAVMGSQNKTMGKQAVILKDLAEAIIRARAGMK